MPRASSVTTIRSRLFRDNRTKRLANLLYLDVLTLARAFTDLLPGPIRNLAMRRCFTRSGPDVFFDRRVYVKFPWLVHIGARTSINRAVEFYPDLDGGHAIYVGADCYVAPHVRFHAAGHDLEDLRAHVGGDIVVQDGVWLGTGCLLLPGVTVGRDSIVAAGSVVTQDVPDGVIVAGVPARILRSRGSSG